MDPNLGGKRNNRLCLFCRMVGVHLGIEPANDDSKQFSDQNHRLDGLLFCRCFLAGRIQFGYICFALFMGFYGVGRRCFLDAGPERELREVKDLKELHIS